MTQLETTRAFFAHLVTGLAGVPAQTTPLAAAFAAIPREKFLGPAPWLAVTPAGYVPLPSDDPAVLYQDFAVAILSDRHINNGQPSLHARCLAALQIKPGENLLHVGAGTGYYTALLAELTGPTGSVLAFEVDKDLADRATANLTQYPHLTIQNRSGVQGPLPKCDVLYVNAGATHPLDVWLDALRPGGRLLFPLTTAQGAGAMLMVTRTTDTAFAAKFVSPAAFIHCLGARDEETAKKLAESFRAGGYQNVQSLRRHTQPDATCWFAAPNCWLSTVTTS